jgi:hypothetical protein
MILIIVCRALSRWAMMLFLLFAASDRNRTSNTAHTTKMASLAVRLFLLGKATITSNSCPLVLFVIETATGIAMH